MSSTQTEASMVNKEVLVGAIAANTIVKRGPAGASSALTKAEAEQAFDAVVDAIKSGLTNGQSVRLSGIGSFRTRESAPRQSRNPRTGEPVTVPSRREVKFTAAKELKEAVAA